MRFPKMRPRQALELKIHDLAGGLNLRDGLSEVLDNQLTDCKNMWWSDGVLKTRPGMKAVVTPIGRPTKQSIKTRDFPEIKHSIAGETYYLQVAERLLGVNYSQVYATDLVFFWRNEKQAIKLTESFVSVDGKGINYFVCCKKNFLYCFTNDFKIHKLDITSSASVWEEVKEEDIYAPLVMTHGKTVIGFRLSAETLVEAGGVMLEGYNLLGNRYRMKYSAINKDILSQTSDSDPIKRHQMLYSLLHVPPDGSTVTVKLTNKNGTTFTHTAVIGSNHIGTEETDPGDGLKLQVTAPVKTITFLNSTTNSAAYVTENDTFIEDNLEINAPCPNNEENLRKIFNMTQCSWFGGTASGLAGGTRLFLCGNKDIEKSLVCYSGLDNPLYFPENSYFYVGDTTTAVTGFGKQSDKLIVFKENETWYTYYQQNNNIDAKDLINQSIVDYASSSVFFPLCQINANIGCKFPETIQLCRNRLVWLSEDGNVYTLVSDNQYNERSIFCVSEMVKKSIKKEIMSSAVACDWNGYYCLLIGKTLYLMDYNSYGYTHIASYSKTEDANIRIPWYIWQLPKSVPYLPSLCALNDKMFLTYYHDGITANRCSLVGNVLSADNEPVDLICYEDDNKEDLLFKENLIESKMTTKLFDFGQPSVRKNIDKINLQLGNNGGETINVKVITECGQESHEIVLTGTQTQSYTPEFIDSKAIFPCIRQVCKIGLELSSTGVIAIDGMNFKYKTSGGAR